MDASTLAKVMTIEGHQVKYNRLLNKLYFDPQYGGPTFKASSWMAALNQALVRAKCTTAARVEMFLAQLGAESGSFRYTEELASGSDYEWRRDLGNIYAGDGRRFKGRSYIQITGRHNYTALSAWAFAKGYVPTKTYFVDHPSALANVEYIFLGAVWYWTVARNMNRYADNHDIVGATQAVNGGYNNLSGRTARWNYAKKFGNQLLPSGVKAPAPVPPKHAAPVNNPAPRPVPTQTYVVKGGDTLSSIAARYHTTWQNLQKINGLSNPNVIKVGQKLKVVGTTPVKNAARPKPTPVTVTVHSGDTLSSIASRNHTTWQNLQKLNNLKNPNLIRIGQKLKIR